LNAEKKSPLEDRFRIKKFTMRPAEYSGSYLSVTVGASDFASFEIWNFIEKIIRTPLEDVSLFRDFNGDPTGVVIAQLTDDIPISRLDRFKGQRFKDSAVEVRLFNTMQSFQKFIRFHANLIDDPVRKLLRGAAPPIIYVLNFEGTDDDLKCLFSKCGDITLAMAAPFREGRYYTLYFAADEGARRACRLFNGYSVGSRRLVVSALHHRSGERTFAIRGLGRYEVVASEVEGFGKVAEVKNPGTGTVYVAMEQVDAAKAACALLNRRIIGEDHLTTFFVDPEFFNQVRV
jgi:hypothetical protein